MDAILAEGESGLDDLVGNLARNGWAVAAQALSPGLVDGLRAEVARREGAGELQPAGVGRQRVARAGDVRRAWAGWLDGRSPAETEFLRTADDLRRALNRRLYLGLFEFEAQFLLYPPGGFYARHVDSLGGARSRIVSLVAYLNAGWRVEDGGELLIWRGSEEQPVTSVPPEAGTLVLMLSEETPHEARPAKVTRRAIAGWFRLNASRDGRIDVPA
jgi:SM-20-related protein